MAITISGSGITSANIADGTIVNADINSSAAIDGDKVSGSFGKVLQVVQHSYTGTATTTAVDNTFVDTPLTVNITPSATSSKVLVMVYIGKIGVDNTQRTTNFRLVRDSTDLSIGDAASNRVRASFMASVAYDMQNSQSASMNYLDSPSSTSELTYKVMWSGHNGDTHTFNYGNNNDNSDAIYSRAASSIIVMEIGV